MLEKEVLKWALVNLVAIYGSGANPDVTSWKFVQCFD